MKLITLFIKVISWLKSHLVATLSQGTKPPGSVVLVLVDVEPVVLLGGVVVGFPPF
jgi:hypothetical protein